MSHCRHQNLVVDYLENNLDPVRKDEFEKHLCSCPYCQAAHKELTALYALLAKEEIPQPDDLFWREIRQRIGQLDHRSAGPSGHRPWRFRYLLLPTLAAAAVLLIVTLIHHPTATIEYSIPIENIIQHDDFNLLSLDNLVDDSLYQQLISLETYFEPAVDDALDELNLEEKMHLIKIIKDQYGDKT